MLKEALNPHGMEAVLPPSLMTPAQFLKGVGPRRALAFQRMGVKTIHDVLRYFPRWHLHRSWAGSFHETVSFRQIFLGRVLGCEEKRVSGRHMLKILLEDALNPSLGHGVACQWVLFNQPYIKREMVPGRLLAWWGRVEETTWGRQVQIDAYEFLPPEDLERLDREKILPVYHATALLSQETLRQVLAEAVEKYARWMPEALPEDIRGQLELMPASEALLAIHRPQVLAELDRARRRWVFEELFFLQMFLAERRKWLQGREKGRRYRTEGPLMGKFQKQLPFSLTGAQRRVIGEILADLGSSVPMNRLLQGDVGSGKTVVAAHAVVAAVESGFQAAVMAPTEILAEQHAVTFRSWLEPLGLRVAVLVSRMPAKARKGLLKELRDGVIQVVVGTHALLEASVVFQDLGVMVIDERHKFGVKQRRALQEKSRDPDCLMMTATPFPRALVLTLYGDTDLSLLDELPSGRKPIKTQWMFEKRRQEVYDMIRQRVQVGEQVYMVYPTIDSSMNQSLRTATAMAEKLSKEVFPDLRLGLLHGRLAAKEKESLMGAFHRQEVDILISTTVIEVGIDVSQATVIVVEHAERFGLAQLHQLRGRVGRGSQQAYCYLMTGWPITPDAKERLRVMERWHDGFEIAERDLELRGPGELLGTKQHGSVDAQWLDVKRDAVLLESARTYAERVAEGNGASASQAYLTWMVAQRFARDGALLQVS